MKVAAEDELEDPEEDEADAADEVEVELVFVDELEFVVVPFAAGLGTL